MGAGMRPPREMNAAADSEWTGMTGALPNKMCIRDRYLQSVEFAGMIREKSGDLHRAQVELLPETGHANGRFDDSSTFELELRFLRESL